MGSSRRPQPKHLGEKLLAIRQQLGLSQAQMASRLDTKQSPVYPTHVSEFERGKREPSLLVLLAYGRTIGVSTDVLIDDEASLPVR